MLCRGARQAVLSWHAVARARTPSEAPLRSARRRAGQAPRRSAHRGAERADACSVAFGARAGACVGWFQGGVRACVRAEPTGASKHARAGRVAGWRGARAHLVPDQVDEVHRREPPPLRVVQHDLDERVGAVGERLERRLRGCSERRHASHRTSAREEEGRDGEAHAHASANTACMQAWEAAARAGGRKRVLEYSRRAGGRAGRGEEGGGGVPAQFCERALACSRTSCASLQQCVYTANAAWVARAMP